MPSNQLGIATREAIARRDGPPPEADETIDIEQMQSHVNDLEQQLEALNRQIEEALQRLDVEE